MKPTALLVCSCQQLENSFALCFECVFCAWFCGRSGSRCLLLCCCFGILYPQRWALLVRHAGQYAYCTAIQELDKRNRRYRVLALSATPGTDLSKVQDVITELHIAHIEVRTRSLC